MEEMMPNVVNDKYLIEETMPKTLDDKTRMGVMIGRMYPERINGLYLDIQSLACSKSHKCRGFVQIFAGMCELRQGFGLRPRALRLGVRRGGGGGGGGGERAATTMLRKLFASGTIPPAEYLMYGYCFLGGRRQATQSHGKPQPLQPRLELS